MARLTKEDVKTAIYQELARTTDYANSTLVEIRRKAWNYYLNRPRGDEIEGRSKVQDTTVRDVTHALLATIMPSYATDHVVDFEPMGPDDIDQAEAESNAVNNLFTESNRGYRELYNAIHSGLLFRNGIIKVWVEDKEEVSHRRFQAPAADVLAGAPDNEDWELKETDADTGISTFLVTRQMQDLKTEAIEPSHFFVDPNADDLDLQNSRFIAELTYFTRSELLEMGVSRNIVKDLPATPDKSVTTQGASATDVSAKFIEGQADIQHASTRDRDEIQCFWVHMSIDRDGDGISEKYRFLISGENREVLLDDPVDFFPYASGSGWPVPHRWSGLGVYDLERITQDERTNARRQMADNLNVANNSRPIYDPAETDANDIVNGAPGRGIKSRNPANVTFMPTMDVTSNSIAFLQYMDGVRDDQTGAALSMQSAEGQLLKEASGISVEMQLQPREQMAALVSRNFAESIVRQTFLLIHQTLRTAWTSPIVFRKADNWQQTMPAEWAPRTRLNVNVGLSPGERRRKNSALQFVMNQQLGMIQAGNANIVTTLTGWHKAMTDWMKSAELDGAEGYFLDPASQESQQGQMQAAQQAQQQNAVQQAMMQFQMRLQAAENDVDYAKIRADLEKFMKELAFKYWEQLLQADVKEQEIESNEQQAQQLAASAGQANQGANGTSGPGQRDSD